MGLKLVWKSRLLSSARTGVACLIAALLLQYAHGYVKWTSFPVFSFVLSFVLASECPSLARLIQDSCSVVIGSIQGLSLGMLMINLLGPTVPAWTSLLLIFFTSMVIAYPSFSSLLTKRIALTVAVHLHVVAYAKQQNMDRIHYPVKLGATILLGLTCSILALTFPIPKFASIKVRRQITQSSRMVSQAFNTLLTIFTSNGRYQCQSLKLEANSLIESGSGLVLEVHNVQLMECIPFSKKAKLNFDKWLNKLILHLKAMEVAANAQQQLPESTRELLKDAMSQVKDWSTALFDKVNCIGDNADKLIKDGKEITSKLNESLKAAFATFDNPSHLQSQITSLFFLHNMKHFLTEAASILQTRSPKKPTKAQSTPVVVRPSKVNGGQCPCCKAKELEQPEESETAEKPEKTSKWLRKLYNKEQTIVALKISLAMIIGSFAGYKYDRFHTNWTTLIIGMGFNDHRDGSFRVSDVRLHGVVLGTLFGYLVSIYTENYPILSIVAMAAWIVFASFMKHSRLYGPLGNVSALIGAIFLVGHHKRVPLDRLAMVRLTDTFIGIAALVLVDFAVFPRKSAAVARSKLVASLEKLDACSRAAIEAGDEVNCCESCHSSALEKFGQLKQEASSAARELSAKVRDAVVEHCGWNDPFEEKAYAKILSSQTRILDLLQTLVMIVLEIKSRSIPWSSETLGDLQSGVGLAMMKQQLGPSGDVENQSSTTGDDCWSPKMVEACRARFQEMVESKNSMSGDEILIFGAFIFNAQALAIEFAKVEKNVAKLIKL